MKLKSIFAACAFLFCGVTAQAQNESVTNESIIELLGEGFGTEEIIGYIEAASTREVKMGINEMRALKAAGASAQLISFLQKIAKTDYGYEGVMWWNTGGKPKKVYRCAFEKESSGFNGGLLGVAGGIAGAVLGNSTAVRTASIATGVVVASTASDFQRLVVQGNTSKTKVTKDEAQQLVFRFFLPKTDHNSFEKVGDQDAGILGYQHVMSEIQSPNEFQCVKMKVKKNKRTFPDGAKYTVAGFSASSNGAKNVANFEINEINNNTFDVIFKEPLEPGEYIFFYKNGLNNKYFQENPFGFDFSVGE